jgi:hypothetical protein
VLEGYDEQISMEPFALNNTGVYMNYYVPIFNSLNGLLVRMRLQLTENTPAVNLLSSRSRPTFREALAIDYVRIVRAPEVWRVRGCLER